MDRRIVGEEIEYAKILRVKNSEGKYIYQSVDDELLRQIFKQVIEPKYPLQIPYLQDGFFMDNGGQIRHETTGNHIEISTPECLALRDIIAQDKATELMAFWISSAVEAKLNNTKIVFHKKNSDLTPGKEGTRGCHENYCVESELMAGIQATHQRLLNPDTHSAFVAPLWLWHLLLFMETRQILSGGGGFKFLLYPNGRGETIYCISPRAFHTFLNFGRSTTSDESRGIIDISRNNEPLADPGRFGRLHLICGDANMAEASIFLKFGMTSAVLEMIENNCWDESLLPESPDWNASLFRAISRDLTCRNVPIRLRNGQTHSAVDIQKLFACQWYSYIKTLGFPEEKVWLYELWCQALHYLEYDDPMADYLLDWKIKLQFYKKYCEKKSLPLEHDRVVALDLEYHNPDAQEGVYNRIKNKGLVQRLISDAEIAQAYLNPPLNTRAELRRYLFDIFTAINAKFSVKWDSMTFKSEIFPEFNFQPIAPFDMSDPFVCNFENFNTTKKERIMIDVLEAIKRKIEQTKAEGLEKQGGSE